MKSFYEFFQTENAFTEGEYWEAWAKNQRESRLWETYRRLRDAMKDRS